MPRLKRLGRFTHCQYHLEAFTALAHLPTWCPSAPDLADHLFELPPGFFAVGDCYGGREYGKQRLGPHLACTRPV